MHCITHCITIQSCFLGVADDFLTMVRGTRRSIHSPAELKLGYSKQNDSLCQSLPFYRLKQQCTSCFLHAVNSLFLPCLRVFLLSTGRMLHPVGWAVGVKLDRKNDYIELYMQQQSAIQMQWFMQRILLTCILDSWEVSKKGNRAPHDNWVRD